MNKNIIITLVVVGLLALFGFYFFNNKPQYNNEMAMMDDEMENVDTTMTTDSEDAMSMTGSLDSLMASGKNVVCTFSTDQNGMDVNGMVHVSSNKMNGTFDVKVGEMAMSSHLISDGTWMYTWSDGSPQGVKMNLKAMQDNAAAMDHNNMDATMTQSNLDNLKQEYNLSCSPWVPDAAAFVLPEGVTFTEL